MKSNALIVSGRCWLILVASGCQSYRVPVKTGDEASFAWQRYRDRNGLGGSDMEAQCGDVVDEAGKLVARVSYNGRVWSPSGELWQEAVHVAPDIRRNDYMAAISRACVVALALLLPTLGHSQDVKKAYLSVSCVVAPSLKIQPTIANVRAAVDVPKIATRSSIQAEVGKIQVDAELAQAVALGNGNQICLDAAGDQTTCVSAALIFSVDADGLTVSTRGQK